MKKILLSLLLAIGSTIVLYSQSVGINIDGSTPHTSSILDIKSSTKGLLIPRMTTIQRSAIPAPATGLMVFDTNTNSYWYYDGSSWINQSAVWSLGGNTGTTGSHFIGTTDYTPLFFRVNNTISGQIGLIGGNTALGY